MLPHVVDGTARLSLIATITETKFGICGRAAAEALAERLEELLAIGGLTRGLKAAGVVETDLPRLAGEAAGQWTGNFNPRPFGAAEALELYQRAY
jgi:alcohol dehydrogenase